jgi:hypothetical protein
MPTGPPVIDSFGIDDRETGFGTGLRAHLGRDATPSPAPPPGLDRPRPEGDPVPDPSPSSVQERGRQLDAYAAELAGRERRLAELEQELSEEAQRLAAADAMRTAEPRPVPDLLREHAEQHAERLLLTLEQALDATDQAGLPDHHARLAALRLLLDEAYREPAGESSSPMADELGELRRRRGLA